MADTEPEPPWYLLPIKAMQQMIPERFPLLRLAIPTQIFTLALAYLIVWQLKVEPMPIRCTWPFWHAVGLMVGLEIALMAVFVGLKFLVKEVKLPGYLETLMMAIKKTSPLELVVTCACVGFVEEVAFRGVLYPLLGLIPSALLFGAAHRPRIPYHWFVLCTMGCVFAAELILTGGLLVPIVHHALHDLWALGLLYAVLRAEPEKKPEAP